MSARRVSPETVDSIDAWLGCLGGCFMSLVYAIIAAVAIHFIRKYW